MSRRLGRRAILVALATATLAACGDAEVSLGHDVDRQAARIDRLESELDSLESAVPSTTAPPPTFLATTTTTLHIAEPSTTTPATLPPTVALTVASHDAVAAIVASSGAWDFALPVPNEGLAEATWSPTESGGTLAYTVPASADDTAAFFRAQLNARQFRYIEARGGAQATFTLGSQGRILVGPASASTTTLSITVSL